MNKTPKIKYEAIKKGFNNVWEIQVKYQLISLFAIAVLTRINTGLVERNHLLELQIKQLKNDNSNLKKNVVANFIDYEKSPLPTWIKKAIRQDGKLRFIGIYFNKAYERDFGYAFNNDRNNLIGKNNFELGYPKDIAFNYWRNDSIVFTGKLKEFRKVEHSLNKDSVTVYFDILKYYDQRGLSELIVGKILKYHE